MKADFGRLAKCYLILERLMFGRRLEATRRFALERIETPIERALLVGDGDGRFALELLKRHPRCQIDSIDLSAKMLETSRRRIKREHPESLVRFNSICADIRSTELKDDKYDYIGLHYVLDCFTEQDCTQLLVKITNSLREDGKLSYADFSQPEKTAYPWLARIWVCGLYFFFKLTAQLETQQLPHIECPTELESVDQQTYLGGLLVSQLMKKKAS